MAPLFDQDEENTGAGEATPSEPALGPRGESAEEYAKAVEEGTQAVPDDNAQADTEGGEE